MFMNKGCHLFRNCIQYGTHNKPFGLVLIAMNEVRSVYIIWLTIYLFSSTNGCTMCYCIMLSFHIQYNFHIQDNFHILEIFHILDIYMNFYTFLYHALHTGEVSIPWKISISCTTSWLSMLCAGYRKNSQKPCDLIGLEPLLNPCAWLDAQLHPWLELEVWSSLNDKYSDT